MPGSPREATWDIHVEDGIVAVLQRGDFDYALTQKVAAEAMAAAHAARTWWMMFDFHGARVLDYHAVAVEHGNHAVETGLARYRIALVGRPGDPMLLFFETVGVNRGVSTRSFATHDEAKRWLRG